MGQPVEIFMCLLLTVFPLHYQLHEGKVCPLINSQAQHYNAQKVLLSSFKNLEGTFSQASILQIKKMVWDMTIASQITLLVSIKLNGIGVSRFPSRTFRVQSKL